MKINNLVLEIMKIALEKNTEHKNTIMCNFYGHCLVFECSVYKKGWKDYAEPDYRKRVCLDMNGTIDKLNEILEYLKNLED